MPKNDTDKPTQPKTAKADPFKRRASKAVTDKEERLVHVLKPGFICNTDSRGNARPRGRSPLEIVVDASEGFIPLWAKDMTLRWRFNELSMNFFENPGPAKAEIRKLLGEALLAWGDAAPVKFSEQTDTWDFEIVMRNADDCDASGCVLAAAFFPDAGRHELELYPVLFQQPRAEQVETLIHEIGHVFGLRHFFANISETPWASQIFGTHNKFTIMNYGNLSQLTADDKSDLKRLYQLAWSGQLTNINGTPIRLVKPFHTVGAPPPGNVFAVNQTAPVYEPQPEIMYPAVT